MCQHKFRPSTYHCPEDPEGPRSSGPSRLFCAQQAPCSKSRKSVLLSVVLMSCPAGLTHTHTRSTQSNTRWVCLPRSDQQLRTYPSTCSCGGGVVTKAGEGAHSARGLGRTRPPGIYTCIYATWDCKDATDDDGRGRAGRRERGRKSCFFAWAIKAFTIMSEHGMFSCLARSLPHIVGLL